MPRISLVIPAYNEQAYLPRLLSSVNRARAEYVHGPDAMEVVVADNGSTDDTAAIARDYGCRVVPVAKRVIAAARNGGAAVARGEILAFVDADSRIHTQTFNVIEAALATGKVVAGSTGVTMDRWSLGIAVTFAVALPLIWFTRFDSGVVFCRRLDFETIGGYNEDRLFAEDLQFLWDLRMLGKSRGQKLIRATAAKTVTSTRKFDKHGEWHFLWMMLSTPWRYLFARKGLDKFARNYWYKVR